MPARHAPTDDTRRTVQSMAGYGIPQEDIATVIGITHPTLREHYRRELDLGTVIANSKVAQNLFRIATGEGREAVVAAIFWLKTRAGWSEFSATMRPAAEAALGKKEEMLEAAANPDASTAMGSAMRRRAETIQ
jgi:hypothetical protein